MESLVVAIGDWLQTWAQPLAAFGSIALSAALVILYFQQKQLLKESYDANHRAVVEVENYEIVDNCLRLTLSNIGNGVATDLELVTATAFDQSGHLQPGVVTNRVMKAGDGNRGRQSLKPHEDDVTFESRPSLALTYSNDRTDRVAIRTGMDELDQAGVELLRVHWYLRYQDLRGTHNTHYITGIEVEVDTEIDLLEWMYASGTGMVYGEPNVDPETLELDLSDAVTGEQRTVI